MNYIHKKNEVNIMMEPDKKWHDGAKSFFQTISQQYKIPPELAETLHSAASNLSVYLICSDALHRDGPTVETKYGCRPNPAGAVGNQAYNAYLKAIKLMGIFTDGQEPKRKPGRPGRGI